MSGIYLFPYDIGDASTRGVRQWLERVAPSEATYMIETTACGPRGMGATPHRE